MHIDISVLSDIFRRNLKNIGVDYDPQYCDLDLQRELSLGEVVSVDLKRLSSNDHDEIMIGSIRAVLLIQTKKVSYRENPYRYHIKSNCPIYKRMKTNGLFERFKAQKRKLIGFDDVIYGGARYQICKFCRKLSSAE